MAALEVVKSLGVKLKEVEILDFPYGALIQTVIGAEAASIFEDVIRTGKIDMLADENQAASLKAALEIPAADYLKAQRIRSQVRAAFRDMFHDVDMLLAPARMAPAPTIAEGVGGGGGTNAPGGRGLSAIIPAANLAGLPAVSLPCGLVNGLPVAISFIGRAFYENQLFSVGRGFQAKTDWHRRRPPLSA
jgi:aspartyl-tRNA(Asn)/glutamyl-tRNA(Gln) amidotransferase subunit A